MMVTYSILESPDNRSGFSQDRTGPGRSGRVLSCRIAGFSCRRQEVCFAGLAGSRLRKSDAYAGAAGSICRGSARNFSADSWRLGKDGTHTYPPCGGEQGRTDGCAPHGVELRVDKNAKTGRKKSLAKHSTITDKKRGKRQS